MPCLCFHLSDFDIRFTMDHSSFFDHMHSNNIILTYKGEATYDLVNALLATLHGKIDTLEKDINIRKRLYSIVTESLQNIVHHADVIENLPGLPDHGRLTLLLVTSDADCYSVKTGNSILSKKADELREWLDTLNCLSDEELKGAYRAMLDKGELSNKGTAGLGFLDMLRKSGQKLSYDFRAINDTYSVFSFSVNIPKTKAT
jgi:hypothetical protein